MPKAFKHILPFSPSCHECSLCLKTQASVWLLRMCSHVLKFYPCCLKELAFKNSKWLLCLHCLAFNLIISFCCSVAEIISLYHKCCYHCLFLQQCTLSTEYFFALGTLFCLLKICWSSPSCHLWFALLVSSKSSPLKPSLFSLLHCTEIANTIRGGRQR